MHKSHAHACLPAQVKYFTQHYTQAVPCRPWLPSEHAQRSWQRFSRCAAWSRGGSAACHMVVQGLQGARAPASRLGVSHAQTKCFATSQLARIWSAQVLESADKQGSGILPLSHFLTSRLAHCFTQDQKLAQLNPSPLVRRAACCSGHDLVHGIRWILSMHRWPAMCLQHMGRLRAHLPVA